MGCMWSSFYPIRWTLIFLIDFGHTYLGKIPWDAFVLLLCIFDPALQSAVGECVALVEIQAAFVSEKTPTGFW